MIFKRDDVIKNITEGFGVLGLQLTLPPIFQLKKNDDNSYLVEIYKNGSMVHIGYIITDKKLF